ncbi:hypothetical protein KBC75_03040 [Candidatus Shapirobacteria bacterium]|nr:hypothetical protein [Candidatus Shapirobacteria bacterium]
MLRIDEQIDQESYKYKIIAEKWEAKADKFRYDAYTTRSKVNSLFADALKLKEEAYRLESLTDDNQDPIWKKIYQIKADAFKLEEQAQKLNAKVYDEKRKFYVYQVKASLAFAKFTALKAKGYLTKIKTNAPGECGPKKTK